MRTTFIVLGLLVSSFAWANDCRVTELPDRYEVFCEGDAPVIKPDTNAARISEVREQRRQVQRTVLPEEVAKTADLTNKVADRKVETGETKETPRRSIEGSERTTRRR